MMNTDKNSIVSWLIVQHQVLSLWLEEIARKPGAATPGLISRIEEHERWLARSIDDLTAV